MFNGKAFFFILGILVGFVIGSRLNNEGSSTANAPHGSTGQTPDSEVSAASVH